MNFFTELKKEILAPSHPLIKEIVKLRKERDFRDLEGMVLIMGNKMVEERSQDKPLELLIISKDFFEEMNKLRDNSNKKQLPNAKKVLITSEEILKKLTSLQKPEPMAAIVAMPQLPIPQDAKRFLLLDQIADPGNLGTLMRTAVALNWDAIILTPNSVDPFNDKALRAAKGASFSLPIITLSPDEIINSFIPEKKIDHIYLADMEGTFVDEVSKDKKPLMLIMSNESKGISTWAEKTFRKISIPISSKVESLNVAISGAILMYQLRINEQ